ncbi:hypothetical protein AKJ09_01806 [Labilithrix luteola]|uniref:Uncharacterized protein n=1 Tax=Labilithrix luteola TaxID=1391654 RepID=A0A0K1PNP5_9BACT|nr:hypothetical protein AKJ09_01806 [Labilithrix luteola]
MHRMPEVMFRTRTMPCPWPHAWFSARIRTRTSTRASNDIRQKRELRSTHRALPGHVEPRGRT